MEKKEDPVEQGGERCIEGINSNNVCEEKRECIGGKTGSLAGRKCITGSFQAVKQPRRVNRTFPVSGNTNKFRSDAVSPLTSKKYVNRSRKTT